MWSAKIRRLPYFPRPRQLGSAMARNYRAVNSSISLVLVLRSSKLLLCDHYLSIEMLIIKVQLLANNIVRLNALTGLQLKYLRGLIERSNSLKTMLDLSSRSDNLLFSLLSLSSNYGYLRGGGGGCKHHSCLYSRFYRVRSE